MAKLLISDFQGIINGHVVTVGAGTLVSEEQAPAFASGAAALIDVPDGMHGNVAASVKRWRAAGEPNGLLLHYVSADQPEPEPEQEATPPAVLSGTWDPTYNDFLFQVAFPPSGITSLWQRVDDQVTLRHVINMSAFADAQIPQIQISDLPFPIATPVDVNSLLVFSATVPGGREIRPVVGSGNSTTTILLTMFETLNIGAATIQATWSYLAPPLV